MIDVFPFLVLSRIAAYYSLASEPTALVLSFILHIFLLDTPRRLSLSLDRSIKRNSVIPAQRIMSTGIMRDHTDAAPLDFLNYFQRSQPVPTDQLLERIRDRDWEGARQRAVTHPWDARYQTESNSTALHLVCVYRAPCNVVQMVLDAFPNAVMATDGEGWTPLHVAFLYGADEQTCLLLIKRGGANVAGILSRLVGSPLHVACRHGVSTNVLQQLLKANPTMATIPNQAGTKPGTLLYHQFVKQPAHAQIVTGLMLNKPIDTTHPGIVALTWRVLILLNAVTGRDTEDTARTSPKPLLFLHEVVSYQTQLGLTNVVPLAIRLHSDQLSKRDEHGNLPLHIAVSTPVQRSSRQRFGRFQAVDAVDVLLQAYPQAASIADAKGRLPLFLALEKGRRTWNDGGIQALVTAAPRALATRCVKTHFYPLQLAAAASQGDDDLESLTTVYQLLLAWPPVLQYSTNQA